MVKLPIVVDESHRSMSCVFCNVHAQHFFFGLITDSLRQGIIDTNSTPYRLAICTACNGQSIWNVNDNVMIHPSNISIFKPHPDLPESCVSDFKEAADVFTKSPRAAAALLRLVIQRLMIEVGQPGKNINEDIGRLVQDGLPEKVQKALDVCRVVGNNAVHPGEIDLKDTPEVVESMFKFINIIINNRITQPNLLNQEYSKLPEGALKAIEQRDQ